MLFLLQAFNFLDETCCLIKDCFTNMRIISKVSFKILLNLLFRCLICTRNYTHKWYVLNYSNLNLARFVLVRVYKVNSKRSFVLVNNEKKANINITKLYY